MLGVPPHRWRIGGGNATLPIEKMVMIKNPPLVSVIIPVYNCEDYLAEAIESVLAQSYQPLDVNVVDDGSTDRSAVVARGFASPVRYYFQPNGGIGAARNRGTELARGSFFAFLDADDRWVEDKLERQMAAFEADPALDIVFGHVRQFHSPELPEGLKERTRIPADLMPGCCPSAMVVRRDAFFRVGPFETHWRVGEFMNWYVRAIEAGLRVMMLSDQVVWRRVHLTNHGIHQRKAITEWVQILKASLDRRRAGSQERAAP